MVLLHAQQGLGCGHCEHGHLLTMVETGHGRGGRRVLKLCLECTLGWFPGRDAEWVEERHAPYGDHVREAMVRGVQAQLESV